MHFEDERIVEFISKKRTPTVLRYQCNGDGTHVVYEKGQGWLV